MPNKVNAYHFNQSPFFKLRSRSKLAKILCLSLRKLEELSRESDAFYLTRTIHHAETKKSRSVETPRYILKTVHKRIKALFSRIEVPNYILSPRSGGSTIQNALLHQGEMALFKIDIQKYFPSIQKKEVYNFFRFKMECSEDVSAVLANIVTFSCHLSTGSSLSPIMSYHVNSGMWEAIYLRVSRDNCKLSVWMDDICISGPVIPGSLVWDIKKIIFNHKFKYHKERKYGHKEPKNITGIIVTPERIMARKGQHRKLRELRKSALQARGLAGTCKANLKIEGLNNYIIQVEGHN